MDPDSCLELTLLGLFLVLTLKLKEQCERIKQFQSNCYWGDSGAPESIDWGVRVTSIKELDSQYHESVGEDGNFTISMVWKANSAPANGFKALNSDLLLQHLHSEQ